MKNILRSIKNLISYFSIIWNDRDWDQHYFYILMKKKLERMRDYNRNHGHCVNSEYTAQKIDIAIKLLDRIIKDDFGNNEFYDEFNFKFIDGRIELETKIPEDEFNKKFKEETDKEYNLRKKYIKTLFSLLEKRIERFWD